MDGYVQVVEQNVIFPQLYDVSQNNTRVHSTVNVNFKIDKSTTASFTWLSSHKLKWWYYQQWLYKLSIKVAIGYIITLI